jgi:hypothetical protein
MGRDVSSTAAAEMDLHREEALIVVALLAFAGGRLVRRSC